jgi:serine/threonine-protein kinase
MGALLRWQPGEEGLGGGGAAVPLIDVAPFGGAAWPDDRTLLVGSGVKQGLLRTSADGGTPSQILTPTGNEMFYAMPSMLPGGTDALISVYSAPPNADTAFIDVLSLADKKRKTVARGGTSARYLPSGHLIYSNRNTVFAVPFDLATRESRGTAVPVLTDVAYDPAAGLPQMDISRDGTLVYRRNVAREGGASTLAWLDAAGKRQPLHARSARYASTPRLSPDGKRVATTIRDGAGQDIWIYDIERDSMTRLTLGTQTFVSPVWSPDGRFIICGSIGNGLFWFRADGGGQPQPLVSGNRASRSRMQSRPMASASSTTRCPGLHRSGPSRSIRARDSRPVHRAISEHPEWRRGAAFSPDGRWLAFESNESGRLEIYVRPFPASAPA